MIIFLFCPFLVILGAIAIGPRLCLIVGIAFEGDLDGVSVGGFELEFFCIAEHVHQFLDDDLFILLHGANLCNYKGMYQVGQSMSFLLPASMLLASE